MIMIDNQINQTSPWRNPVAREVAGPAAGAVTKVKNIEEYRDRTWATLSRTHSRL
jgi:hypothetical protein